MYLFNLFWFQFFLIRWLRRDRCRCLICICVKLLFLCIILQRNITCLRCLLLLIQLLLLTSIPMNFITFLWLRLVEIADYTLHLACVCSLPLTICVHLFLVADLFCKIAILIFIRVFFAALIYFNEFPLSGANDAISHIFERYFLLRGPHINVKCQFLHLFQKGAQHLPARSVHQKRVSVEII